MKYVCVGEKGLCCAEFDQPLIECPECGGTTFRIVGTASEKPDNKEYEALKKDLWG